MEDRSDDSSERGSEPRPLEAVPETAAARILELLPLLMRRWSHEQREADWPVGLAGGLADVHAIRVIESSEGLTAGDFARLLWISESAATAVINRLENAGLVARERETRDRRVVHLTTTDRGREVLAQTAVLREAQIRRWFKALTASEVEQLVKLFEKLARTDTPSNPGRGSEP